VEKARSLIEAEANLDEIDGGYDESERAEGAAVAHADAEPRGSSHGGYMSGFVPASATQSGFSPAAGRGEPSGLHPRPLNSADSGAFSGVPGAGTGSRLVDSLQSALGASSRNEAGLGSLQRALRDASRAFTASRHAQEALTEELRVMHRGLNELMSEKAAVERYAALLTQERDAALDAAEEARREAKRDREFLLREQDRFIQLLLEEHEAELAQLRKTSTQRGSQKESDAAPSTTPGVAPPPVAYEAVGAGRKSSPPGELSGAALARQALANAAIGDPLPRTVPLPTERTEAAPPQAAEAGAAETRRSDDGSDERAPTYPPAPAVLDLDALASEVDGNSERPPPIRRIGVAEQKIHLKPARVPTQLFDTLVSSLGESDPNRKG
jgi:hypothetical protein